MIRVFMNQSPSLRLAQAMHLLSGRAGLVLLGLGVIFVYLGLMLQATDGHFVPQVVDLYLVCQYARGFAEGHPFSYNPGEAPSTGSTSLLHTALLGLAYALGARGEGLIALAILAGSVLFVASVLLARRIASLLASEREGLLAGALVALGGPIVWGFLYGSDIALFMFLSLWLFERVLASWMSGSIRGGVLAASLLALARPEGLPIGVILGAGWSLGPARRFRGFARGFPFVPAALGFAVLLLNRALTGYWLGTSVTDKSLVANYGLPEALALVSEYGVDVVRGLLLGFYPSQTPIGFSRGWAPFYFPPLGLVLLVFALARLPEALKTPVRLWIGLVVLIFALVSPNVFLGVHFNRYLMWAFPTLMVLMVVGLGSLTRALARGEANFEAPLFRGGAAIFVLLGLLSTLRFAAIYRDLAGEIYRRDLTAADWIAHNLPKGALIANLATSVEYLTGHRAVNLHGVTSPSFFGNYAAEREAGVFEALCRLSPAERPSYLISSVSAQESYATMREVVEPTPLFRTASFGDEILIYRMRYDLVGKNRGVFLPETLRAIANRHEVDHLNICDSRDEALHKYTYRSQVGGLRLRGTARIATYELGEGTKEVVIDAGRAILGSESFSVRASPGKDLTVVMRTAEEVSATILRAIGGASVGVDIAEATLSVEAAGRHVARLSFRPRKGWDEIVFRIPGGLIHESTTEIRLAGHYASFYYWFYQD